MPEPLPFNDWDLKEVQKQLSATVDEIVKVNKKFVSGDHWQDSNGYIGPRPLGSESGSQAMLDNIKKGFVSRNVIREGTRRHKNGVVGIEPRWAFVSRVQPKADGPTAPDPAQADPIRELEDNVTEWWDLRNAHKAVKDATEMSLWGRRGVIRLYIPVGLLPGGGLPKPSSLPAALRFIYIEALDAEQAGMIEDPDTKVQAGAMITVDADNKEIGELVYPEAPFLDPEKPPKTLIRELGGDEANKAAFPMELGGRLTMFEISRDLLITEQIQQSQRALNLDLTIMPRNIIHGGFLERIFLAAAMPGHWTYDDRGNKKEWIPGTFETGAGTTNFVSGQEVEDEATGKTTVTQPQVHFQPPTDVQFAINAKGSHYQDMLEEMDQAHVLITGDATPSGKSRQEARADFEGSLRETQTPVQDAGRWLLETVVAIGEFLMGSPGKWTNKYRAEFECLIDSGPVDSTEELGVVQLRDADLMSEETAMSRIRILDVAAERARKNAEPGANLGLRTKQFEALQAATAIPGVGFDGAAEFLGFTAKDITLLKKGFVAPAPAPAPGTGSTGAPVGKSGNGIKPPLSGKPQSSTGARQRARPVVTSRKGVPS